MADNQYHFGKQIGSEKGHTIDSTTMKRILDEYRAQQCICGKGENNDFVPVNNTTEYSGIEIALNRQGMLRVRTYPDSSDGNYESQEIVQMNYCPFCGRQFKKG